MILSFPISMAATASETSVRCLLGVLPTLHSERILGLKHGVSSIRCILSRQSQYSDRVGGVMVLSSYVFISPITLLSLARVLSLRASDFRSILIFSLLRSLSSNLHASSTASFTYCFAVNP